jgi:hypothetical protein
MSLLTMSSVAIQRDHAQAPEAIQIQRFPDATGASSTTSFPVSPGTPSSASNSAGRSVTNFGQLLVAQIPSEALLAYTTLLALFAAGGTGYKTGRWILYAVAVLICPVVVISAYIAKRNYTFQDPPRNAPPAPSTQLTTSPDETLSVGDFPAIQPAPRTPLHLPVLPAVTATASMAVYGLTVPGSALQQSVSGVGFGIIAGCLAVGGGIMMSIFVPFLGQGNGAEVDPASVPASG